VGPPATANCQPRRGGRSNEAPGGEAVAGEGKRRGLPGPLPVGALRQRIGPTGNDEDEAHQTERRHGRRGSIELDAHADILAPEAVGFGVVQRDPVQSERLGPSRPQRHNGAMNVMRLAFVLMIATVAFVVAASLLAANARPEPGPCNDTIIVEPPAGDTRVGPTRSAPMCVAPEAPAWLVLGGGATASAVVVASYVLLARGREPRSRQPAQLVS